MCCVELKKDFRFKVYNFNNFVENQVIVYVKFTYFIFWIPSLWEGVLNEGLRGRLCASIYVNAFSRYCFITLGYQIDAINFSNILLKKLEQNLTFR